MFGFLARMCISPCFSDVPRRITLTICLALSKNESNLLLFLNTSSSSFGSLSTPERDFR
uniref:Uncharacterized protein n=1 Tax=Arundo donax TaxID=35708 RepID=A0A0A9D2H3_ARUDO